MLVPHVMLALALLLMHLDQQSAYSNSKQNMGQVLVLFSVVGNWSCASSLSMTAAGLKLVKQQQRPCDSKQL